MRWTHLLGQGLGPGPWPQLCPLRGECLVCRLPLALQGSLWQLWDTGIKEAQS